MAKAKVRKGMPSVALTKAEFAERFKARFYDPACLRRWRQSRSDLDPWQGSGGGESARAQRLALSAGRVFSVIVHGDASGTENLRRILTDWLTDIGMIAAGSKALVDRYIGYYRDYATSNDDLDHDRDFHAEVRNAAETLITAVALRRKGRLEQPDAGLKNPRPK